MKKPENYNSSSSRLDLFREFAEIVQESNEYRAKIIKLERKYFNNLKEKS